MDFGGGRFSDYHCARHTAVNYIILQRTLKCRTFLCGRYVIIFTRRYHFHTQVLLNVFVSSLTTRASFRLFCYLPGAAEIIRSLLSLGLLLLLSLLLPHRDKCLYSYLKPCLKSKGFLTNLNEVGIIHSALTIYIHLSHQRECAQESFCLC